MNKINTLHGPIWPCLCWWTSLKTAATGWGFCHALGCTRCTSSQSSFALLAKGVKGLSVCVRIQGADSGRLIMEGLLHWCQRASACHVMVSAILHIPPFIINARSVISKSWSNTQYLLCYWNLPYKATMFIKLCMGLYLNMCLLLCMKVVMCGNDRQTDYCLHRSIWHYL